MPSPFRSQITLKDATGLRFRTSLVALTHYLTSRQGLGFLALATALLLFSDPPNLLAQISLPEALLVWVLSLLSYLTAYFLVAYVACTMVLKGTIQSVWTPCIGLICIAPVVSQSEVLIKWLAGPDYQIVILRKVIFYYFITQIIEFAFIRLILPSISKEPETTAANSVRVGDQEIDTTRVRFLEAREHYVRVVLAEDEFVHRVRLGDLVAQFDEADGLQPHRSWWVSRHANPRLERNGARAFLVLDDGTEIPVARGRQAKVADWLSEMDASHRLTTPVRDAAE